MIAADEMFKRMGYEKREVYIESGIVAVIYEKREKYSTTIEINVKTKEIKAYIGKTKTKVGVINVQLLSAICKKIKELSV